MEYTFISGATGGIGKAFCLECAKLGYNLFLTGRNTEKLLALKQEIELLNNNISIEYYACDLNVREQREKMFEHIFSNGFVFNRIINVAGVDTQKAFLEYTREKLLFQMGVNAEATIDITYSLLKSRAKDLEIITISSMSGVSPMPYFAIYSGTKCLLTNVFTSLHYELKNKDVKVTTVLPGGVYTREDIKKEIKSQGLWGKLSAYPPETIAKKSLKAVKKNKIKLVPGFANKFLYCMMKILPKRLVLTFIAKRWKTHQKDAF